MSKLIKSLKQYLSLRGLLASRAAKKEALKKKAIKQKVFYDIFAMKDGDVCEIVSPDPFYPTKWRKDKINHRFFNGDSFMTYEYVAEAVADGMIKFRTTQTTKSL